MATDADPRAVRLDAAIGDHRASATATDGTAMAQTAKDMGRGVRWMGPTQVVIQVVRVGSLLVLTRLLTPQEFGLVALVTVLTGLFERVLGDTGTTTALVRHPTISHGLASSVLWLNVAIGGLTTLVLVVFGAPIASLLGDADATDIVRVMGFLAVINGCAHVPRALFRRRMLFSRLAATNLTNAVITAAATIGFAAAGWGEWAIVVGNLSGTVTATVLAWVLIDWRPALHFSRRRLSEIAGFSSRLTIQNIFGYISFAGDRFIVGRFVGTTELGYYGMANRLMRYPIQTTAQTYRDVVFPNLARLQDDHRAMTTAYERSVSGIAFVIFPLCGVIAALADPLVAFGLGPKWVPATDVLALVAVTSGLQAVASTTGSLYNARGRADLSLRWQVFSSLFLLACYSIGARWDLIGVAWSYLIGIALLTPLAFAIPLRLIGARVTAVLRTTAALGLLTVASAATAHVAARLVDDAGGNDPTQLTAGVVTFAACYGGVSLAWRPRPATDLLQLVRRRT
ncbi:MAG: lipopolysaccharide biosynthesis protein [Actinomycetota bacterium]